MMKRSEAGEVINKGVRNGAVRIMSWMLDASATVEE